VPDVSAWIYLVVGVAAIVIVNAVVLLILSVVHRDEDGHTPD
jgi:hypothetical protein